MGRTLLILGGIFLAVGGGLFLGFGAMNLLVGIMLMGFNGAFITFTGGGSISFAMLTTFQALGQLIFAALAALAGILLFIEGIRFKPI